MAKAHTGVYIINLGTPDSPSTPDVRKYLREFLMDRRVIDIKGWQRWLLVNLIIAPFRSPKSAKVYKEVWTPEGSPLMVNGIKLEALLQQALGEEYIVSLGMRYQSPSIAQGLEKFKDKGLKEIIVIPLYPQYASATTGSTIEAVFDELKKWELIPSLQFVSQFLEREDFIDAFVSIGKDYIAKADYDHYVFSYHGLPERQILKSSCDNYCQLDKCCNSYHSKNKYCYRAQCFHTTRLMAAKLGLNEKDYTVSFQSRLGKDPWIKPYTEDLIHELVKQGKKKVLVFSPAFVSDCLETTIEIGEEYKEVFLEDGGEQWDLVPSLNTHPMWVQCLVNMVKEKGEEK